MSAIGVRPRHLTATERNSLERALARADVYRVLAAIFRDPDDRGDDPRPDVACLRSAARALEVGVEAGAWRAIRRIEGRVARAVEHRVIFGHTVAHGCPPYETEYGQRHLFGQSQELGDIRGFYEAFGVRPRRGGERPDHLACELEFLSLLAIKEASALAVADGERIGICRDAATLFLRDHAGRWVAAFAARISARSPGSGYAAAATLAAATVAEHGRDVGAAALLLDPDDLLPVVGQPDGFTFECGVDAAAGDLVPPGAGA